MTTSFSLKVSKERNMSSTALARIADGLLRIVMSVHVGFVVDKVALGQGFLRVLRFSPVNISFHRRSPNSYHLGNA
jgi:hypothetical protein